MHKDSDEMSKVYLCEQNEEQTRRYINIADINLMQGYGIDVFVQNLDSPISLLFTKDGDMIISESGLTSGNARVLQLIDNTFVTIADNFIAPITGTNYYNGVLFISQRSFITRISPDGVRRNIITGLPSNGDYYNSKVEFGPDNKLYFGQGTATNSGVVGQDNTWVSTDPLTCDYPGDFILLNGQNFVTPNITNEFAPGENVYTGAFSPYGIPNIPYELRKGYLKASGSILRANLDGTGLELYAWGLRNPTYLRFDEGGRLFVANQGYDIRGSRPIANAPDEFYQIHSNIWYGWPDYAGGEPVTLSRFRPEGRVQPEFLIKNHPNVPPKPFATFPMDSNIMGFDFNYNRNFGPYGDVYLAEYGSIKGVEDTSITSYAGVGHRVSRIDKNNGMISTFAINKSGFPASATKGGGFERLTDLAFGPDGAMYILDIGINEVNNPNKIIPYTGVVWRIYKT